MSESKKWEWIKNTFLQPGIIYLELAFVAVISKTQLVDRAIGKNEIGFSRCECENWINICDEICIKECKIEQTCLVTMDPGFVPARVEPSWKQISESILDFPLPG